MNSFNKSTFRTIKSSISRFLAILLISFLGAGVFAGLFAVSPNMQEVTEEYYKEYNTMDINMLSTFGFSNEDVLAIIENDYNNDIKGIMPSYSVDAAGISNNSSYTFQLNSLTNDKKANNKINRLNIIEGRLPENKEEIIIIRPATGLNNIEIGSYVNLKKHSNELLEDFIDNYRFKIVGIAESPYHLSFLQGNTSLGSGIIDYIIYTVEDAFISDYYTNIYMTLNDIEDLDIFSKEYENYLDQATKNILTIANDRETIIYDEFMYDLKEAKIKLDDAETELSEGIEKYDKNYKIYQDSLELYNKSEDLLDKSYDTLIEKQAEFDLNLKKVTDKGYTLDDIEYNLIPLLDFSIKQKNNLKLIKTRRDSYEEGSDEYIKMDNIFLGILKVLDRTEDEADEIIAEIPNDIKEADDLKLLITSRDLLDAGFDTYETSKEELLNAKIELDDAKLKLDDARVEINDGRIEYEKAKLDIKEAEDKLSSMLKPKWIILNKQLDESFANFKENTYKMKDLATIFPIVFFLVAALVSLTTMTRMVDEDRTLIGTFKSLGYSNGKIAFKYIGYAITASAIGSILGVFAGFYIIPKIVWNAYGIIFTLPPFRMPIYLKYILIAVLFTTAIIALSTSLSVRHLLKENPAQLMRPKAPKEGKKVLLERITPLWSRFNFIQKVTYRNLSLNIKRITLTIIGIMGSTALVVTAFGARDAVAGVIDKQFEDVYYYDTIIGYSEETEELDKVMNNRNYFLESGIAYYNFSKSLSAKNDDSFDAFVVSPDDSYNFNKFIKLIDPKTNNQFRLHDNSVVITEKLALNLDIGIGDRIYVDYLTDDEIYDLVVTDITVNYTLNYIYVGKDIYKDSFGVSPKYNQYYTIKNEDISKHELTNYITNIEGVSTVSYIDEMIGNIRTTVKSVNTIILILMIAAGMLAFIVLYNLANINVGERHREIATFKVLGFYPKETHKFIFKEINILNLVSVILGLFAGLFLYRQVIITVEPPMLYLTRYISLQSYIGAFLLTLVFGFIVNQAIKPKVNKIDMLESLQSNE